MTNQKIVTTLKGKIFKGLLISAFVFGAGLFIYAQKMNSEPTVDRVIYLSEFYTNSGYNQQREYKKDIEDLKRIKQEALDQLNYGASAQYFKDGSYDLKYMSQEQYDRFILIDSVIEQANKGIKNIKEPDYTQINQATVAKTSTKEETQKLDFINLLK